MNRRDFLRTSAGAVSVALLPWGLKWPSRRVKLVLKKHEVIPHSAMDMAMSGMFTGKSAYLHRGVVRTEDNRHGVYYEFYSHSEEVDADCRKDVAKQVLSFCWGKPELQDAEFDGWRLDKKARMVRV